jgi:hypothetical protein
MEIKKKTYRLCIYKISVFFTLAFGCSKETPQSQPLVLHQILGRETNSISKRLPLYQIKAPSTWTHIIPPSNESLIDTTKFLSEFLIYGDEGVIKITIHNFPTETIESRIPPSAQIARWKQQFSYLDPISIMVSPQSYSGFVGLLFEGTGIINNESMTIIGWSMQLDSTHFRILSHPSYFAQLRADVTIKATGPKNLMTKHYSSIYAFARSFELIDEIPVGL